MSKNTKEKTLSVRLGDNELALIKKEAQKFRVSVPEYVRSILNRCRIGEKVRVDPDFGEVYELTGKVTFPVGWFDD